MLSTTASRLADAVEALANGEPGRKRDRLPKRPCPLEVVPLDDVVIRLKHRECSGGLRFSVDGGV